MTNLPTAAEVLAEAVVLARGLTSGPHDLARAELLLKIAHELRVGTPKVSPAVAPAMYRVQSCAGCRRPIRVSVEARPDEVCGPCGVAQELREGTPKVPTTAPDVADAPRDLGMWGVPPVPPQAWDRATETHPLDAPAVVRIDDLPPSNGDRLQRVASEDATERRRLSVEPILDARPTPPEFTQRLGRALRLGPKSELAAVGVTDETVTIEMPADVAQKLAEVRTASTVTWPAATYGKPDEGLAAAIAAFGDDRSQVAARLWSESVKREPEASICRHCRRTIRHTDAGADDLSPAWRHAISMQTVCPEETMVKEDGCNMGDERCACERPVRTYAEPIA